MGEEERAQLAIQLVRFLAILYAEILRMLQMVDQDDVTVLLQLPETLERVTQASVRACAHCKVAAVDETEEHLSLMQVAADRFGVLLQKLLGLFEKLGQPGASVRATFLLSMLADVQRPGTHVSAAVVEKMGCKHCCCLLMRGSRRT